MRQGIDGEDGQDGLSAYQVARKGGFVGTQVEWLASLNGERGLDGKPGDKGDRGEPGLSGSQGEPGPRGSIGAEGKQGPTGERGLRGLKGAAGADGRDGWTPILAVVEDGERRVHQVTGWAGGTGPEPQTWVYLGPDGYVLDIKDATDLRGARGPTGNTAFVGGGGISEARVLELIEAAMPAPDVEYERVVTTVTDAGDNILKEPAAGKALRIRKIKCTSDPDSTDTPMLTLSVGDKLIQRGPALYGSDFIEGIVDAPLVLNLEVGGKVGVTIHYEEFSP